MRFLLLSHDNEEAWQRAGETEFKAAQQEAAQLACEVHRRGEYLLAAPLHPAATGKVVRRHNGDVSVTDGPFTETHEVVGGFYLVDVPSLEDAIRIAKRHPGLRFGAVEIRELAELEGLPPEGLGAGPSR